MDDGQSSPAQPTADLFWISDGSARRSIHAEDLLRGLELGTFSADTEVQIKPDAPPKPLRKYLRELVWMAHTQNQTAATPQDTLFEALFDGAPIGVVYADLAGRIRHANPVFASMLGYGVEELRGMRVGEISDPAFQAREIEHANALLSGRVTRAEYEKCFLDKAGHAVEVWIAIAIAHDEKRSPLGVIAHVIDLRQSKALESAIAAKTEAVRESEARFERIFQHAPQAMFILDDEQQVLRANHRAQQVFGYPKDDFRGKNWSVLVPDSLSFPGFARRHTTTSVDLDPDEGAVVEEHVRARHQSGSEFPASMGVVVLPVSGQRGHLVGITDRTQEEHVQQTISASLREKETLLKEIHHRVKNNLQIISSLLMLQAEKEEREDTQAAFHESVHRVRSMALIHQQLYGVESLARIDFAAYAQELAESLRVAFAPQAQVQLDLQSVHVTIDLAVPLGLVLHELLTNAFKYGIDRALRGARRVGADVDIVVRMEVEGDTLSISVTDGGVGLPPDFQLRTAQSLGMELIRTLCRQLRAKLDVDVHEGTQFIVRCPLEPKSGA